MSLHQTLWVTFLHLPVCATCHFLKQFQAFQTPSVDVRMTELLAWCVFSDLRETRGLSLGELGNGPSVCPVSVLQGCWGSVWVYVCVHVCACVFVARSLSLWLLHT